MAYIVRQDLTLIDRYARGPLSVEIKSLIGKQALEMLCRRDPILSHLMEIKVVCNERRNFVNVLVRKQYTTMCHKDSEGDIHFCYFLSDKLEPFVIVTALHRVHGRLKRLSLAQVEQLARSLHNFKRKFGISGESYHYSALEERVSTDKFVLQGHASSASKSHSVHFHLKMRIATAMYVSQLAVCSLFDLSDLRASLEPIRYQFNRECRSLHDTLESIRRDSLDFASSSSSSSPSSSSSSDTTMRKREREWSNDDVHDDVKKQHR
jgi:hypothetical protein